MRTSGNGAVGAAEAAAGLVTSRSATVVPTSVSTAAHASGEVSAPSSGDGELLRPSALPSASDETEHERSALHASNSDTSAGAEATGRGNGGAELARWEASCALRRCGSPGRSDGPSARSFKKPEGTA